MEHTTKKFADALAATVTDKIEEAIRAHLMPFIKRLADESNGKLTVENLIATWSDLNADFPLSAKDNEEKKVSAPRRPTDATRRCPVVKRGGDTCNKACLVGGDKCATHTPKAASPKDVTSAPVSEIDIHGPKTTIAMLKDYAKSKKIDISSKIKTKPAIIAEIEKGLSEMSKISKVETEKSVTPKEVETEKSVTPKESEHGAGSKASATVNFDKMTVTELKNECKVRGIVIPSTIRKKDELIALVKNSIAPHARDEDDEEVEIEDEVDVEETDD
jgi:hypothetical protein